jgi:hypothetical protein
LRNFSLLEQLPFDHCLDQRPTYPEPAQTQAATFATDIPIEIARARYEPAISTESAQNLQEALDRGVNHATPLEATQDDAHEVKKDREFQVLLARLRRTAVFLPRM